MTPPLAMQRPLGVADHEQLAALHANCLPDSAVARLGADYARSFYRYLSHSRRERAFAHHDSNQRLDGACILSFEPWSLNRRLWLNTSLAVRLCQRIGRDAGALWTALSPLPGASRFVSRGGGLQALSGPELILLYVEPAGRRQGVGTHLLGQVEALLRADSQPTYVARTREDPTDPAWSFYRASGFHEVGHSDRFRVWEKTCGV